MRNEDREVLAAVAKLNNDMGGIVLSLITGAREDGSLEPDKLRELAAICDDLSALLDNHADRLDGRNLVVIAPPPESPADASDFPARETAPDRTPSGKGDIP